MIQYFRKSKSRLSLLEKTRLANEALLVTDIIGLLHKIAQGERKFNANDALISRYGVKLLDSILKGEMYLSRRERDLIPQPENTETVLFLKEKRDVDVKLEAKKTSKVLKRILTNDKKISESKEGISRLIDFNRSLHSAIMERLIKDQEVKDRISFR